MQQFQTTKCAACGAEILFFRTALNRKTPVNAEPVWVRPEWKGGRAYVLPTGGTMFGEIVKDPTEEEKHGLKQAYVSHFAACMEPDRFRRRNRGKEK